MQLTTRRSVATRFRNTRSPLAGAAALFALLALSTVLWAQPKPSFSGEWTMVPDKSDFGQMPTPGTMTRTITHKDPMLKIVTVQSGGATGDRTIEATYSTDGQPQTNTVMGNPMRTVGKWDGAALVFSSVVSAQGVEVPVEERFTLSDGGKTLTITREIRLPDGAQAVKVVFTKK